MDTPIRDTEENVRMLYKMSTRADCKQAVGEFYDKWAEHYDEDLKNAKYGAPPAGAEALSKVLEDKNAPIVDCAAGTGQVGVELAKRGFKTIDAVDFSQKSLDISASKGVYRKLICDTLAKNKLKGVEDGSYTGLTCIGAIGVSHITEEVYEEWNRIVKKGGFMVFSIGKVKFETESQEERDIKTRVREAVTDHVKKGSWELLEQVDADYLFGHNADIYTVRRL